MNIIVKGNSTVCYRGVQEHLDDYMGLLKPYFRNIAHHHHVHHAINKDAILIYSYFPMDIPCSGCHHSAVDIHIKNARRVEDGKCFYDIRTKDLNCERVDRIFYDNVCVGYYCNNELYPGA